MVTIKMENRVRLYIFSFCCLNFLVFSLRGSEVYLCCVSCFYFCKITVFITGNAPLILKIFNNKTDIYFFLILEILFFLLSAFVRGQFRNHDFLRKKPARARFLTSSELRLHREWAYRQAATRFGMFTCILGQPMI